MRVVVAEKPSVARDLARVLGATNKRNGFIEGSGLRISWCFGHMAELEEPAHYDERWKRWSIDTLPMLPEQFDIRVRKGAADQMKVLRSLLRGSDVEEVVNACDAGREGELIFRYVYQLTSCSKPVQRLWVSSLTDSAIKLGWSKLRPGSDFDPLADAARCRAESDWLVGLNATRALTCLARDAGGGELFSVGRVQTPTLAMIVSRDREIENFVPETFWQVKATFEADDLSWKATWFKGKDSARKAKGDAVPKAERIKDKATAEAIAAAASGQVGSVSVAARKQTTEKPPLLYDLTSLQRRANQRYGFPADKTLNIAQDLYEKHKLITYPRTDARYLTPDQVPGLPDIVRGLQPVSVYKAFCADVLSRPIKPGSRVVNAKEVGDHHAILPTGKTPSTRLDPDAKRIFDLIARRFLAALSKNAIFDVTRLVVDVSPPGGLPDGIDAPLRFRSRGRVCRQQGWRAVDPPGKSKDLDLPPVEVGDAVQTLDAKPTEGKTRPPRPHNDASILKAMETAGRNLDDAELKRAMRKSGLGTPATRAAILNTLVTRKYVERVKKELRATERGCAVIDAVPIDELKSAELTGRWEGRLANMAEARDPRNAFMSDVQDHVATIVAAIAAAEPPKVNHEAHGKSLGDCPACGKPVRERGKVYGCDSGKSCPFLVFKTMTKRAISARMVRKLLKEGRSDLVKGFKSKKGNEFTAGLIWDVPNQRVGFWFPPRVGDTCPKCGKGRIIQGKTQLGCDRWRDGCDYRTGS